MICLTRHGSFSDPNDAYIYEECERRAQRVEAEIAAWLIRKASPRSEFEIRDLADARHDGDTHSYSNLQKGGD
jgi:hypothetical protein